MLKIYELDYLSIKQINFGLLFTNNLSNLMNNQSSKNQIEQLQQDISEVVQLQSNKSQAFLKKFISSSRQIYHTIIYTLKKQSRNIYAILVGILMLYTLYISYVFDTGLKCPYTNQAQCIGKFLNSKRYEVGEWILRTIINSIILVFFIHLFLWKKTYRLITLLGIFQLYWLFIHGQKKMNPMNMGGMFKVGHVLFFSIMIIIYGLIIIFRKFAKKHKKIFFGAFFVSIVFLYLLINNSCYFWKFGINGEIYESSQLCRVLQPNCWFLYIRSYIDFSPFLYKTSLGKPFQLIVDENIPNSEKGSIIAFSNTNSFTEIERASQNLQSSVFKHTVRYKSLRQALNSEKKYDVVLDNQEQKYHIRINRNESLVRQRKEVFEKAMNSSSPPIVKNILFLFFDSISRAEAHVMLPTTLNWFKKSSNYESYLDLQQQKVDPNSKQAYEFYRYNSIGYQTTENGIGMYFGLPYTLKENMLKQQYIASQAELRKIDKQQKQDPESVVFFGKDYQDRGFITSSSGSYCNVMNADQYKQEAKSFSSPRFDHETHSFACDPNFQKPEIKLSFQSGPYSATDRNLYGRKMSQYAFQYALSFFDAYKDVPKLQVLNLMEGHDFYAGSTKHSDEPFRDFFNQFQSRGYSNDTVIILASDHGQHSFDLLGYINQHFHGLLVVNLPANINAKYRDGIRKNQQNLVTAWNIYHTMQHLLKGEEYKQKYMSLLSDLSFQKTCKDAKIPKYPPEICACVF